MDFDDSMPLWITLFIKLKNNVINLARGTEIELTNLVNLNQKIMGLFKNMYARFSHQLPYE